MDLSIIIVNWNSIEYLRRCLKSVYSNIADIELEVVVVDNASYDGSGEMVSEEFPQAKYVQSEQNLGFARANNLGFASSAGDYLLFLNPDTEVIGDAINVMLKQLKTIPDAGIIGCKLLNSDLSVQTTCIQPFPTLLNQILDTDYLILRLPRFKMFGVKPLFFYAGKPEPVEVVSGACLMIKRKVFEAVEGFTSDYFMYGDDLDLCFKVRRSGLKAYYVGDVSVIHHGGKSVGQTKVNYVNAVLKKDSVNKLIAKHRGRVAAVLHRVSIAALSLVRILLLIIALPFGALSGKSARLLDSLSQWMRICRWSFGLEVWARAPQLQLCAQRCAKQPAKS